MTHQSGIVWGTDWRGETGGKEAGEEAGWKVQASEDQAWADTKTVGLIGGSEAERV
jgi:hypothetical protein